jgi:acetyl esterase/lipase
VKRHLAVVGIVLGFLGAMLPAAAAPSSRAVAVRSSHTSGQVTGAPCTDDVDTAAPLTLTVEGEPAEGLFALPAKAPKAIVVFAHGYGHTVESWRTHLTRVAREDGVVAVAMNYRGTVILPPSTPGGLPQSRGWQVAEGAEDSIAAVRHFLDACPAAKTVVMYSVSMGGNAGGLAVAAGATRPNGNPLFDFWVNIEGATNVTETYHEARLVARSGNAFAVNATADIERQMGGTFEQVPQRYLDRTVVLHTADIAASGLQGVISVHGLDDGLVPYNQSRELTTALHAAGVPTEMYTVATRGPGSEPGTTITGTILGPTGQYTSPFAGHASESSTTHIVGMKGFELLSQLLRERSVGCGEFVVDGTTGLTTGARTAC